ncbi:hypothetical protein [Thiomicrorhabdus sediminis]|uniref:Uncharacterized protein n=1 Tax=Thiomicrorhabdus sediminis TaxID=2580412 RepID=A0A4V1HI14_9GAMM|nr:hypothetical protein [Thiomicrorhabdus sediminis]QCU90933.1 hypothetical protein FE785_10000 [Thiomicrorhabdus sediminis]
MEILDWAAILGALAWTPHVFSVIKNAVTKPVIRVITKRDGEIGFTVLGPIFNIRIAFSVENRDIVVSGLKIKLVHESGEEKIFEWQGIRQQVLKMTAPDGSVLPYEKEQSVLAIKLNQKEIEERSIECQETLYLNNKYDLELAAVKKLSYLKQQEKYEPKEFIACQEMTDLYSFIKQSFSWKTGRYTATIELHSPEEFKLVDNQYEFILTPIDIERLEKNKQNIELDYKNNFVPQNDKEFKKVDWNWCNPTLKKLTN